MALNVLEVVENLGKAQTAFKSALMAADTARQNVFSQLGADFISSKTGKPMSLERASEIFGPEGTEKMRAGVKMATAFGEGALSTIAKEVTGSAYQQAQALAERGISSLSVGGGPVSGLTGALRTLAGDTADIAREEAISGAIGEIGGINATVAQAEAEREQARAVAQAAGISKKTIAGVRAKAKPQGQRPGRRPGRGR